ncbi:hypothetical protein PENTCL1PPCAC_18544, partial [Pristionchus entomophagus]
IDYNRRLHLITLSIAVPIALLTYPLQVFTSYRLLTNKLTAPIYKLIVLNGALGIFQFLSHLLTRQLPAFYEFSFIYEYLQANRLEWTATYLMTFSYIVRIQSAFLIAVNRYLTFRPSSFRWMNETRVFNISIVSNIVFPLVLAAAFTIFGGYHYIANPMEDGRIVYRPELPFQLSIVPPLLYFLLLAICACFLNGYVVHRLVILKRNKTLKSVKNSSSERGLALTSVSTICAQLVFLCFFLILLVYKTKLAAAINIIPLTLNHAAPFWFIAVLISTVPTVRKTLPTVGCRRAIVSSSISREFAPENRW